MLQVFKTRKVKTPERNGLNAGFDFFIPEDFEPYSLYSNSNIVIPSGIKVRLPKYHVLIAFNKSGIATKNNLIIGACVIDENYTGEIHLDIHNIGTQSIRISPNKKIVQFILIEQDYHTVKEVSSEKILYKGLDINERGSKGFGSTG